MRFQDAAPDARAVVYAGIQADPLVARVATLLAEGTAAERWLARAVMNGERTDPATWRRIFPSLFGQAAAPALRDHAGQVLDAGLEVANRGEAARSQYRGAVVEELTARILARRAASVRRERRVLFDGVRAEIHPYDVTVESTASARGLRLQVGRPRDQRRRPEPARRRPSPCRRRGRRPGRRDRRLRRPTLVRASTRPIDGRARCHRAGRSRGARRAGGEEGVTRERSRAAEEAAGDPAPDPTHAAAFEDRLPYRIVRPYRVRFDEATASETIRTARSTWPGLPTSPGSTPRCSDSGASGTPNGASSGWCGRSSSTYSSRSRPTPVCSSAPRCSATGALPPAARARSAILRATDGAPGDRLGHDQRTGHPYPRARGLPAVRGRRDARLRDAQGGSAGRARRTLFERRFHVRRRDLDPLDHVNNSVYVDYLEEALEAAGQGPLLTGHAPAVRPGLRRVRRPR